MEPLTVLARVVRFTLMTRADLAAFAADARAPDDPEADAWHEELVPVARGERVAARTDAGYEVEQRGRRAWWPQQSASPCLAPVGEGAAAALAGHALTADADALGGFVSDLARSGHAVTERELLELPLRFELDAGLRALVHPFATSPTTVGPGTRASVSLRPTTRATRHRLHKQRGV